MNPKLGPYERHFAVALDGTTMTFECKAGHRYRIDFAKRRPVTQRLGETACRMFFRYWSREHSGCTTQRYTCPKCRRAR